MQKNRIKQSTANFLALAMIIILSILVAGFFQASIFSKYGVALRWGLSLGSVLVIGGASSFIGSLVDKRDS